MEKQLAAEFFQAPRNPTNNHEEWLLREYSKLMHLEAEVRKRESNLPSKSSSNDSSCITSDSSTTRPSTTQPTSSNEP
jgi:hypothetical protein